MTIVESFLDDGSVFSRPQTAVNTMIMHIEPFGP